MSIPGFSAAGLGRMRAVMAGHVERGEVPGIVTLLSRGGEVQVEAFGMKVVGGLIVAPPDVWPIQRAVREAEIMTALPNPPSPHAPDEWMRRLGVLPLMHQPGEKWMYHTGSDVLGVLIARASGQPFEAFLRERLFEPLGMKDTGFSVPAATLDRLASCYKVNRESHELELHEDNDDTFWSHPPTFPSGGGGLVSTVSDYRAFGQMMLDKGMHGQVRVLASASVAAMTTDHVTPEQKAMSPLFPGFWDHRGWGFGLSMVTRGDDVAAVPGRFGWDGGFGTSWYSDPGKGLVGILMIQRLGLPLTSKIHHDFWRSAYEALAD